MVSNDVSTYIKKNIEYIEAGDFKSLYANAPTPITGELTDVLYSSGIDPLLGSKIIYPSMFSYIIEPKDYLKNFTVPAGIVDICPLAFYASAISSVTISKSVKTIRVGAFEDSDLESLYFVKESNLEVIYAEAFSSCKRLSGNLHFPDSVYNISNSAFQYTSLESITLPNNLIILGNHCFANTLLKTVRIPRDIKSVGYGVFKDCKKLEEIEIPERLSGSEEEKRLSEGNQAKIRTYR